MPPARPLPSLDVAGIVLGHVPERAPQPRIIGGLREPVVDQLLGLRGLLQELVAHDQAVPVFVLLEDHQRCAHHGHGDQHLPVLLVEEREGWEVDREDAGEPLDGTGLRQLQDFYELLHPHQRPLPGSVPLPLESSGVESGGHLGEGPWPVLLEDALAVGHHLPRLNLSLGLALADLDQVHEDQGLLAWIEVRHVLLLALQLGQQQDVLLVQALQEPVPG
mmetsp:Transcript_3143/g.11397  ORF Transcript_3143/g.11397 Transcript_3143/m.11397 type:complete len:220 (-) Transcript_3143:991-1650(-)